MIVDKRDYKINVLILFMEHEVDVTVAAVETLLCGIEEGVIVSILFNGGSRSDLREMLSASPHIRYYESSINLGVAGGRNFLLDTEEAKTSDIIMFMDNDVIPPSDYVRSLATFLVDHDNAGIVGATLLNIGPFLRDHSECFTRKTGKFGNTILTVTNKTVRELLIRYFHTTKFYHLGVHEDWYNAYFSSREQYETILDCLNIRRKRFFADKKFDKAESLSFFNRRLRLLPASNVGGGAQAFRTDLINEIGNLNDLFSPFGYEDVDFCIRAIKKGYRNYIDTNTFLLHGTDNRQEKRHEFALGDKYINEYRCLTLLFYLHFPEKYEELIRRRILYDYVIRYITEAEKADEYLYYSLKGYHQGKGQIMQRERSQNVHKHIGPEGNTR